MLSKVLRFECSGVYANGVTRADQWKASRSTVIWTLALTLVWMALHVRLHDDPRVDSLSMMPFMFSLIYSMRYTYLKGRPGSVQAIVIGGATLAMAIVLLAAGWVAARL